MQDHPSLQPSTSQAQFVLASFMPYIEGSKMDLTAWIQYGLSMKIFASLKWMKLEQDFTCLQASTRVADL